MAVIDFALVEASFSAAAHSYEQAATVQQQMALQLATAVAPLLRHEGHYRILEIGSGPGNFTQTLLQQINLMAKSSAAHVTLDLVCNDLSASLLKLTMSKVQQWMPAADAPAARTSAAVAGTEVPAAGAGAGLPAVVAGTGEPAAEASAGAGAGISVLHCQQVTGNVLQAQTLEQLHSCGPFNVIVSNAVFQWFPHLDKSLQTLQTLLSPQGYLAFSSFAHGTLAELKAICGEEHGLRYLSGKEGKEALLAAGLLPCYWAQERVQHYFSSAREVLRHLKHTGVNALSRERFSVREMRALLQRYEERFSHQQGVVLSWCPYMVVAQKQQRHSSKADICGVRSV